MFSSSRKPYTAITVQIERLTSPEYEADDFGGVVDLIEVIRIQDTGPTEAARALRKKLKYGSVHRQLRALTILDGLIQNAGPNFQRTFADEALLERLRIMPRDEMVDNEVREKCNLLFRQWAVSYKGVPGLANIAMLYKQLPSRRRPTASQSKVVQETERDAARDNPFGPPDEEPTSPVAASAPRRASHARPSPAPSEPSTSRPRASSSAGIFSSSKKEKKAKHRSFNVEREKPNIMNTIAAANVASTNLFNALKFINRETHKVAEDRDCVDSFDKCKMLRRQILRYIQLVETDQLIGSLLSANDELVKALMAFEIMDKSIDDDSDSENEGLSAANGMAGAPGGASHSRNASQVEGQMKGLSLLEQAPAKPPRPTVKDSSGLVRTPLAAGPPPALSPLNGGNDGHVDDADEDDDENPFGDENAI